MPSVLAVRSKLALLPLLLELPLLEEKDWLLVGWNVHHRGVFVTAAFVMLEATEKACFSRV